MDKQQTQYRLTSENGRCSQIVAKAAYAFVEYVPFFLAGSCRLGDHVIFAVGRGADGLEDYDLKVVGRGEGLGIPSPHPGCLFHLALCSLACRLSSSTSEVVHGWFYW